MSTGWIRPSFLREDVGPGARGTRIAGGTIPANALVKFSNETVVVASTDSTDVVGVSLEEEQKIVTESLDVCYSGETEAIADVAIIAGELLKPAYLGKVIPAVTAGLAGDAIASAVTGLAFTNQPANDGLEIGSGSASDTTSVTVYGTTNGGVTVVKETVVLTGTTFVSTVKTDWGVILGVEIPRGSPDGIGTITVREASGNASVTTLTAGQRSKGITAVTGTAQRAFNHIISAVASGASTKVVGVVGTDSTGAESLVAVTLAGATAVSFASALQTVTKVLVGDLESSRTATFSVDTTLDAASMIVGRALETAVAGTLVTFLMMKTPVGAELPGAIALADNLAVAYDIKEAASSYLKFVTTNDNEKIVAGKIVAMGTTGTIAAPIDMAGATHTLVLGTAGAAQTQLVGNVVFIDANTGSAPEDLVLPSAALLAGVTLAIRNVGGEQATINTNILTLEAAEGGFVTSDGTSWSGYGVGGIT